VVDKGCVVNSIFNYPATMTFFTTPELLEIGDIHSPPPTETQSAGGARVLQEGCGTLHLPISQYQKVEAVSGPGRKFHVATSDRWEGFTITHPQGDPLNWLLRLANQLNIPGEELPRCFTITRSRIIFRQ